MIAVTRETLLRLMDDYDSIDVYADRDDGHGPGWWSLTKYEIENGQAYRDGHPVQDISTPNLVLHVGD